MKVELLKLGSRFAGTVAVAGVALFGVLGQARAISVAGSSSGTFSNPTGPGVPSYVSGTGTADFKWGYPASGYSGNGPSELKYTPTGFNGSDSVWLQVGSLYYFNGTIYVGTEANSVKLNLQLTFTAPSGLSGPDTYTMTLNNTLNIPSDIADTVSWSSVTPLPIPLTVGGSSYSLDLGFSTVNAASISGTLSTINSMTVNERTSQKAYLYAKLTQTGGGGSIDPAVPDSGSTLMLLGFATVCIESLRRKLRM